MTVGDQHVSAGLSRRTVLTAGVAALAFPAALAGAPAAAQPAAVKGVVCGRGRNPTLRLWPTRGRLRKRKIKHAKPVAVAVAA